VLQLDIRTRPFPAWQNRRRAGSGAEQREIGVERTRADRVEAADRLVPQRVASLQSHVLGGGAGKLDAVVFTADGTLVASSVARCR